MTTNEQPAAPAVSEADVFDEARAERVRAHRKHADTSMESQPVDSLRRLAILVEEVGEVAKEFNDAEHDARPVDRARLRKELIQTAAMAGAWADVCGGGAALARPADAREPTDAMVEAADEWQQDEGWGLPTDAVRGILRAALRPADARGADEPIRCGEWDGCDGMCCQRAAGDADAEIAAMGLSDVAATFLKATLLERNIARAQFAQSEAARERAERDLREAVRRVEGLIAPGGTDYSDGYRRAVSDALGLLRPARAAAASAAPPSP